MKKIAIIGAGFYGTTIATHLADDVKDCEVTIFEKNSDILMAASMVNQYRLHRGYHYPRSLETVKSCLVSEKKFKKYYSDCILEDNIHYYAIAKENSLVNSDTYENFCKNNGLSLSKTSISVLNENTIEECFKAEESLIDPKKIKEKILENLKHPSIKIKYNQKVSVTDLDEFDFVIIATYSSINDASVDIDKKQDYQYEVCEKILVKLPKEFEKISLVIMDGPFMCLDPYGRTGDHLLGNVVHAIHSTNVGLKAKIPRYLRTRIDSGFSDSMDISKFEEFITSALPFIPGIKKAKYKASMFTTRVVLPHREATDDRPTLLKKIDGRTISVFSGKIANCVQVAEEVVKMINNK